MILKDDIIVTFRLSPRFYRYENLIRIGVPAKFSGLIFVSVFGRTHAHIDIKQRYGTKRN